MKYKIRVGKISGYQVRWSRKANMSSARTKAIKTAKKSCRKTGLKNNGA